MRLMREQMPEAVLCGNMLKSQCLNKGYLNLPAVSGAIQYDYSVSDTSAGTS